MKHDHGAAARPIQGAYIARTELRASHLLGVAEKIKAQVDALSTIPAETTLLFPAKGSVMQDGEVRRAYGGGTYWRRLTYYFFFYASCARLEKPLDFIYVRYQGSSPLFLWMLWKLRSAHPGLRVLVEVPTYPYRVAGSLRGRLFGAVDTICRRLLPRLVHRIVTFSRQEVIFGVRTIQTRNGVDLQGSIPLDPPRWGETFHILGLANLSFWHGYDRVIEGIGDYLAAGGDRSVVFEVVGAGAELDRLLSIVRRRGLERNVRFHGPRSGQELTEIMQRCHMGVGCIGMHRLAIDTSDLKSREYCARALPFITGYADEDFSGQLPFIYRAPADDSPLDIIDLLTFYANLVNGAPDFPALMRVHAERDLGWGSKMQPVIDYLRQNAAANDQ